MATRSPFPAGIVAGTVADFICPIPTTPDEKWFQADLASLGALAVRRELWRATLRSRLESPTHPWVLDRIRAAREALLDARA